MQVRRLDAARGWQWVLGGFRLLRKRPLQLLALIIFYLFLLIIPSSIPLIGALVPTLLTPVLAVGLMVGMRVADQGGQPHPRMLFAAFGLDGGRSWRNLLILGLISAAATGAAVGLTTLLDGGALMTLFGAPPDGAAAGEPPSNEFGLIRSLTVFLVLLAPIQAATWYAPLFIAWHAQTVGKSLFYSVMAVWRNKATFAVYLVSWACVALTISTLVQLVRSMMGEAAALLSMVFFGLSVAMLAAMYGSVWLSYRDAIDADADADEMPPPPPMPG